MKKVISILISGMFLLNLLSFASADSFTMGYIRSDDDSVFLPSGTPESITPLKFSDVLVCTIPVYPTFFKFLITTECLKKLININN